jgi:hypothetical protein
MQYAPEKYFSRFIGLLKTEGGETLKVFATVSPRHVLMYPANPLQYRNAIVQSVAVAKLSPTTRRRLGC